MRKKYRYICCGTAKITDKISNFRLIGGNQLQNQSSILRVKIPNDLELVKYSCDNYSTTEDARTLEELGCDVMIRYNGQWIIRNDLRPLQLCDVYTELFTSAKDDNRLYPTEEGYMDIQHYCEYMNELSKKAKETSERAAELKSMLEKSPVVYAEYLKGASKEELIKIIKMYINEKLGKELLF